MTPSFEFIRQQISDFHAKNLASSSNDLQELFMK